MIVNGNMNTSGISGQVNPDGTSMLENLSFDMNSGSDPMSQSQSNKWNTQNIGNVLNDMMTDFQNGPQINQNQMNSGYDMNQSNQQQYDYGYGANGNTTSMS